MVSAVAPILTIGQTQSMEHGSVKLEMVQYLPHSYNLYSVENTTVYRKNVEAILVTQYTAMIAPIKRAGNVKGGYFALKTQFVVPSHCDQGIKDTMKFLVNLK